MSFFKNYIFIWILILGACSKPLPQLPSNKGETEQSTQAKSLLLINSSLAQKEDSILRIYASSHDQGLKKCNVGFWYRLVKETNGEQIKNKERFHYFWKVKLMDGTKINEQFGSAIMGHKEIIVGLEECLKLMHKGDSACVLIPSYLAYGRKGKGQIAPYTSIICEVKLLK
jgi:FKBP-type peptidyl-prolyl cis-trans isomerase